MNHNPKYRYKLQIIGYGLLSIFCFFSHIPFMGILFLVFTVIYLWLSFRHQNDKYTSVNEFAFDKIRQQCQENKKSKGELQREELISEELENDDFENFFRIIF